MENLLQRQVMMGKNGALAAGHPLVALAGVGPIMTESSHVDNLGSKGSFYQLGARSRIRDFMRIKINNVRQNDVRWQGRLETS